MSSATAVPNLFSVKGKVVIVTGGGSGIGNMIAAGFAENGAKTYIIGRRLDKLEEACAKFAANKFPGGGTMIPLQGDISKKDTIEKVAKDFGTKEKYLDCLVNNAGISRPDPKQCHPDDVDNLLDCLWSSDYDGWQETMATNLTALYFTSVAFAPYLRASFLASPSTEYEPRETPGIINIASIGGIHLGRMTSTTSYQAAKAGAIHLSKVLATRFTPLRIRVNCISPGLFPSELTATDSAELRVVQADQFKAMPEERAGSPPDIAGPAIFLASRAGAYLNGVNLDVGGGRCLMVAGAALTAFEK